jgi:hypothetical protein
VGPQDSFALFLNYNHYFLSLQIVVGWLHAYSKYSELATWRALASEALGLIKKGEAKVFAADAAGRVASEPLQS